MKYQSLILLLALACSAAWSSIAWSAGDGLMKDFDSLGGNGALLEKAKALQPNVKIQVVQDRIVERRTRVELSPEYAAVLGGDAYNRTQNVGVNLHYHFNPRWSVAAKYNYSFNQLRPEGESLISDPDLGARGPLIPDIDYPKQQALVLVNWYPIYGKMNLYDLGVAHFDVYGLAGAGQVDLKSGASLTYTAGVGVGFWISQNLSTRTELRHQSYVARRYGNKEIEMNTSVLSVQVGYML